MNEPAVIRVLIVDDHCIVAEGMALALGRHADIEVVAVVSTGEEALAAVGTHAANFVLMDYRLASGTGIEAAAELREQFPDITVLMISGLMDESAMLAALDAGASGYISKVASSDELAEAIRRAAAGEMIVPPAHLRSLIAARRAQTAAPPQLSEQLTAREREIVQLMSRGLDNAAIAAELVISYNTVRGHVQSSLQKLNARSKLEAVAHARDYGLLG